MYIYIYISVPRTGGRSRVVVTKALFWIDLVTVFWLIRD